MRPFGDITLDMEKLLEEMIYDHDMQPGEVLGLVHTWFEIHARASFEEYEDGSRPVYFYGHEEDAKEKFKGEI